MEERWSDALLKGMGMDPGESQVLEFHCKDDIKL